MDGIIGGNDQCVGGNDQCVGGNDYAGGYQGYQSSGGGEPCLEGNYADQQTKFRVFNIIFLIAAILSLAFTIIDLLSYKDYQSDYDFVSQSYIVMTIGYAIWLLVSIICVVISFIKEPKRSVHQILTMIIAIFLITICIAFKLLKSCTGIKVSYDRRLTLGLPFGFAMLLGITQGIYNLLMITKLRD